MSFETSHYQFPILVGKEVSSSLKMQIGKCSQEHASGISLDQLNTPMMRQFKSAKEEAPDALLFFRMGDFFEVFGVDAIVASDVCSLTLTSRDKSSENPVPMAGVPVVSYRNALRKCVEAGFKVAVCDQVEDPKQAQGIVKREIVRILTPSVPGDLFDDVDKEKVKIEGNYLAAIAENAAKFSLAFVDVSTGSFFATENLTQREVFEEIKKLKPRELLVKNEKSFLEQFSISGQASFLVNCFPAWLRAGQISSEKEIGKFCLRLFSESSWNSFDLNETSKKCVAAILDYIQTSQRGLVKNITDIKKYSLGNCLSIDENTLEHLEVFQTAQGDKKGTLFWFLNQCSTAIGSRQLAWRLKHPFLSEKEIFESLQNIQKIILQEENSIGTLQKAEEILGSFPDINRCVSRIAQNSSDPRVLLFVRKAIEVAKEVFGVVVNCQLNFGNLQVVKDFLGKLEVLRMEIETKVNQNAQAMVQKENYFLNLGFNCEYDETVNLESNLEKLLENLEEKERRNSQISNLKIGYTKAFGYFFDVSKGKLSQVPSHFIRKQTLTNGERYITPELKDLEEKSLSASERRLEIEYQVLAEMREKVLLFSEELAGIANFVAETDILFNFAKISQQENFVQPKIALSKENADYLSENSPQEEIFSPVYSAEQNWHPVLKKYLENSGGFVCNSVEMTGKQRVLLITGPNMAGKSTVMRQVAITQLLFQLGCFVPAKQATLSVCDRIFTRIGSGDNALKNQSTFFVEMMESASILRHATHNSLIIMDEIGRGTSTFDGIALAQAILERLHDSHIGRVLFSTHYHELSMVAEKRTGIACYQMEVMELSSTEIVFTRRFIPGAGGKSYGLHVAKLAGVPQEVVQRAAEILMGKSTKNLKVAKEMLF